MRIVNLFNGATVQHVRQALATVASELGIAAIDYNTIVGPNRSFTQAVASYFYEQIDDVMDQPAFDGLYYRSRYNQAWECWALFDRRLTIWDTHIAPIDIADPDFISAARLLHLSIEIESGEIIRQECVGRSVTRLSPSETWRNLLGQQAEGFGVGGVERLADEVLDTGFDERLVVGGYLLR